MKRNIYTYAVAGLLALLGCQTDEPSIKTDTKPQEILAATEQLAKIIVNFSDNPAIINEIHHEVIEISKNHDYDESIPLSLLRKKNNQFNAVLQKTLNNSNNSELIDFLSQDNIEIYWPFSEEWDGRTTPTITFKPSEGKRENTGFLKVDNIIKQVVVNDDYAKTKPVWIIRKIEQELPTESNNETLSATTNLKTAGVTIKFFKIIKLLIINDNGSYGSNHIKSNYYIFGSNGYNASTGNYTNKLLPTSRILRFQGAALRFPGKEFGDKNPEYLIGETALSVSKTIKMGEIGTWVNLDLTVGRAFNSDKPIVNNVTCSVDGIDAITQHYNITGNFPPKRNSSLWDIIVSVVKFVVGIITYSIDIDFKYQATAGAAFKIVADITYPYPGKEIFSISFTKSQLWDKLIINDLFVNHGNNVYVYYGIR